MKMSTGLHNPKVNYVNCKLEGVINISFTCGVPTQQGIYCTRFTHSQSIVYHFELLVSNCVHYRSINLTQAKHNCDVRLFIIFLWLYVKRTSMVAPGSKYEILFAEFLPLGLRR